MHHERLGFGGALNHFAQFITNKEGFLREMANRGGIVEFALPALMPLPRVFILNRDLIREVWGSYDEGGLDKVGPLYNMMRILTGEGLFPMQGGKRHSLHKEIVVPHLTPGNLDEVATSITDKELYRLAPGNGGKISLPDTYSFFRRLTLQIITKSLLGTDITKETAQAFLDHLLKINDYFANNLLVMLFLPNKLGRIFSNLYPGLNRSREFIRDFAEDALRQDNSSKSSLLKNLKEAESRGDLTHDETVGEVITAVIAGHATTAKVLTWVMYFLSKEKYRHYQKAIRDEVRNDEVEKKAGRSPTLDCAVRESMRLRPPVYATARVATTDLEVKVENRCIGIPRGSIVVISPYLVHHNPGLWEDPDRFDPERFRDFSRDEKLNYIPFGVGPRRCSGERAANIILSSVITAMLKDFKISSENGQFEPVFAVTLRPPKGMPLVLERLNTSVM